ncbi:HET-domain-containing protein [Hyaloscypha hepaticicola]|uniref:HET-domain-containing protein n=1 Tax=Hyaloscypha hepaticicola TaxID=2082293 RepID=A0A2J6PDR0_9HELO|nr:HET-domain-containing protein [Hyaloscypha hepaticicola]
MPRTLPKRLVHIPPGDNQHDNIRLILTDQADLGQTNYLSLTHCWGGTAPLITTRQNLCDMLQAVPFQYLSKTFQDAIIATTRLGFEYLWIDSLCILQDDDADWEEEASRMGSIYANCLLNIVAAGAKDRSIGCFFSRNHASLYGCTIHNRFSGDHCKRLKHAGTSFVTEGLPQTIDDSHTATRGWCFQETSLAPRSLYFCESQLFWECRAVRRYKLIALSGVVRQFDHFNSSKELYHAGLWWAGDGDTNDEVFVAQLLWHVRPQDRRPRNPSLTAPSWS